MSESLLVEARRELARLPAVLEALLAGVDPSDARTRPATDEWSPVEILCHLRDEESEDFGARLIEAGEQGIEDRGQPRQLALRFHQERGAHGLTPSPDHH